MRRFGLFLLVAASIQTVSPAHSNSSCELSVYLWRAYPDTAVFDWYITLEQKERMKQCDLTYGETEKENETNLVENFTPAHRTFNLHPLRENTSYWFTMICTDIEDFLFSSPVLHFKTDIFGEREPRVGAKFSHRRQDLKDEIQPASAPTDFRSKIIWSLRPKDRISPHAVLGAGCGLVGLIIITVTAVLVLRKYSRFRAEQDILWEQGRMNEDEYIDCRILELETISQLCQQQQQQQQLLTDQDKVE